MTDGLRALPTIRATCAAVALLVRLRPTGAATMRVEQSCRKLRRDTPLFCRCAAIVSFSPVFMDSLRGNVRPDWNRVAGAREREISMAVGPESCAPQPALYPRDSVS